MSAAPPPPPPLILASGSPRRSKLLREAGYRFRTLVPEIDEIEDPELPIREVTAENARRKAAAVSSSYPGAVVLAADTLVLLGDRSLSKPADLAEARTMLERLSGRTHQVFTAVFMSLARPRTQRRLLVTTAVRFKELGTAEIEAYHRKVDPLDKAGAYAAQEHGSLIIDRVEGSLTNVIGLPMDEVKKALAESFGITPQKTTETA